MRFDSRTGSSSRDGRTPRLSVRLILIATCLLTAVGAMGADLVWASGGASDGFVIEPARLTLVAGTSEKIIVRGRDGARLPYPPVFSFDRIELGRVMADGTFVAGPYAGKGTITVSVGHHTAAIPLEITPDGRQPIPIGQPSLTLPQADKLDKYGGNLATHRFFSVQTTGPVDPALQQMERQYPGPVGGLVTDSPVWTGYHRQAGRVITVALGDRYGLEQVSLSFLQRPDQGIYAPREMDVELSADGENWQFAGKVRHSWTGQRTDHGVYTYAVALPAAPAKYVRIRFPVKVWVFARGLQIRGAFRAGEERQVKWADAEQQQSRSDGRVGPVRHLLLTYTGGHGARGTWNSRDFLPMVAYVDQRGRIVDRMFDSFLFLPYPELSATKEAWTRYLDDLFQLGSQLAALEEAMKEYDRQHGRSGETPEVAQVILSLPYPDPRQHHFGRIPDLPRPLSFAGSGDDEAAYEDRKRALEWYADHLLQRWKQAGYSHLRLVGLYWFHELVDDSAPGERQLIRDAAEMAHNMGLPLFWIPYYESPGYTEWRELGFDHAFIQPNYYGDQRLPLARMEAAAAVSRAFGMGLEIEGDERMTADLHFYQVYRNQLIAAHRLGMDRQAACAYYFGSKGLLQAYRSRESHVRRLYDDTYCWMRSRFLERDYWQPWVLPD
ncbi:DUF4855 domain-containing protein [Brevibacillus humidisoli]|uniref:DUF4855 domain-containing protein n=1 Tax=Brevibacillus humidisoli TaxID=2895522 RepID=UPI001E396986|nr:DUF4855 domain-containing protein [Brevibacillus humidisoli]UFJ40240.1 DUF4855 domain-containing protein [Brevibacillus humidisoli]